MFAPMEVASTLALVRAARSSATATRDGARRDRAEQRGGGGSGAVRGLLVALGNRSRSTRQSLARLLASARSRYWAWRLRRASRNVVDSLDELTVLDIASRPGELASLVREIESRTLYWRLATSDARTPAAGPASGHV